MVEVDNDILTRLYARMTRKFETAEDGILISEAAREIESARVYIEQLTVANRETDEAPGRNVAPVKVQCADCTWQGLTTELVKMERGEGWDQVLTCPICHSAFARYPQRIEHIWSDPY